MTTQIQPVQVERRQCGTFYHPAIANLPEMTWAEFVAWLNERGVDALYQSMMDDQFLDDANIEELTCADWEPVPPVLGSGWFVLVIGEDEDGPFVVWARPLEQEEAQ
ncbi:MAG: hypothetical protein ACRDCY_22185 [Aeromonas veronii]